MASPLARLSAVVPGRAGAFGGIVFEDDVEFGMFGLKALHHSPSVILTVVVDHDDFLNAIAALLNATRQESRQ